MDEDTTESPTSPQPLRKSRRSSLAAARRLSRASTAGGIQFEELLATLPSHQEAEPRERLEKLLQLVVSSTTRELAESFRDHEDEDLEEAARTIRMKLRANQISGSTVEEVVEDLEKGVGEEGEIVGGELKKIRDYTKQLQAEGEQWKKFMAERKEMLRNARNNARLVETGELSGGEESKWKLKGEERMELDRISEKIQEAAAQLQSDSSRPAVELLLKDISNSCVRLEAEQAEVSERLSAAARKLAERADCLAEKN